MYIYMECILIYEIYFFFKKKKNKGVGAALSTKGAIYKVPEKKPWSNGPCELLNGCNFTLGLALKI